jgi:hypothetical protein
VMSLVVGGHHAFFSLFTHLTPAFPIAARDFLKRGVKET